MMHHKTYRFIHLLQDFVNSYNSRPHCGIEGYAPNDIKKANERKIFDLQYGEYLRSILRKNKFNVNDKVRLSAYRYAFKKGFHKNYSKWIFMVIDRLNTNPPSYHIKDDEGNFIEGAFYEKEVVKVTENYL